MREPTLEEVRERVERAAKHECQRSEFQPIPWLHVQVIAKYHFEFHMLAKFRSSPRQPENIVTEMFGQITVRQKINFWVSNSEIHLSGSLHVECMDPLGCR